MFEFFGISLGIYENFRHFFRYCLGLFSGEGYGIFQSNLPLGTGLKRRLIGCKRKDDQTSTGLDTCRKFNKDEPSATEKCNTQDCPAQ